MIPQHKRATDRAPPPYHPYEIYQAPEDACRTSGAMVWVAVVLTLLAAIGAGVVVKQVWEWMG